MSRKRRLYLFSVAFVLTYVLFFALDGGGGGGWLSTFSAVAFGVGVLGICIELVKVHRSEHNPTMSRKRRLYLFSVAFVLTYVLFFALDGGGGGGWLSTFSAVAFGVGVLGICIELVKVHRSDSTSEG